MALIPYQFLNAVVSLGVVNDSNPIYTHIGTGFLYGFPLSKKNDRFSCRVYLVTNKHVVELGVNHVKCGKFDAGVLSQPINEVTYGNWTAHPSADISVIPVPNDCDLVLDQNRLTQGIFYDGIVTEFDQGVSPHEGDGVFLMGFPLSLIESDNSYPIVRAGIISRIQSYHKGIEKTFLIDAPAFPGNSGGPVVLRLETAFLENKKPNTQSILLGVVSHQLLQNKKAIIEQTKETHVLFQEDSGLAIVEPVKMVSDTILMQIEKEKS